MAQNHIFVHLHNGHIIDINIMAVDDMLQHFIDLKNNPDDKSSLAFIPSFVGGNMVYHHINKRFIKKVTWEFNTETSRKHTKFNFTGEIEFPECGQGLPMQIHHYIKDIEISTRKKIKGVSNSA